MASSFKLFIFSASCAAIFCISCQKESHIDEILRNHQSDISTTPLVTAPNDLSFSATSKEIVKKNYFLKRSLTTDGDHHLPDPVECAPTKMLDVIFRYLTPIAEDELATENFSFYNYLSYQLARTDTSNQYFGVDGEYTNHVKKIQRDLERFWNMKDMVRINGQHTATLNDRERLADLLFYHLIQDLESREEIYPYVDEILHKNSLSPNLPESPLFAADGFSHKNGLIAIGDGLIQMISETGVEPKITWAGVLAHEWTHQIQANNYLVREAPEPLSAPLKELEADFFAGYYLTHKRGATYNWKKAEQFFDLFFQLGDCSIGAEVHHGTPAQRMEAARLGYELAMRAQKKGHILSALEVHEYFLSMEENFLM